MKKLRNRAVVLMAVASLLATSAVAMAAEGEEDTEDTVFNFGYDADLGIFVWGASSTDGEPDCTLEDGEYPANYVVTDGLVMVDQLDGAPVEDDCALSGGLVAGPEGQVNHGMFLRLFNSLYEGTARGCVIRHIAQTDLGMGDQQVNVEDVDPDADPVDEGASGNLDLTSIMTKCENGNGDGASNGEGNGNGAGNGRPEWAGSGRPDGAGIGRPDGVGKPGSDAEEDSD